MTAFSKAVIVDSQVFVPGAKGKSGLVLENTVEYLMREGKFESRGGLECEPTEMDLKLMAENGKVASLSDIADYGARQGKFEGRNPEIPMVEGEYSGGAWNEFGLVDVNAMKHEIIKSGSNVMRSIITVPREWAPQFGLVTKAQWQDLVRGCWSKSMQDWKIMPTEHQRWCAFFHTDNKVNLHVHILSWDASGCYFTGEKRVPRENFFKSVETVKRAAYEKFSLVRSIEKNYVRQALILQAKLSYGSAVKQAEIEAVRALRPEGCTVELTLDKKATGERRAAMDRLSKRLIEALPLEGVGRASYKGVSKEARAAANLMVLELRKMPEFACLYERYIELVERGADILGKAGSARADYVWVQEKDINQRLANIFVKDAAKQNQPWARSTELAQMRATLIEKTRVIPSFKYSFCRRIITNKPISTKAVRASGFRAIDKQELEQAISEYTDKVVTWVKEVSSKKFSPEQLSRLEMRARTDLAEQIGAKTVDAAYEEACFVLRRQDGVLLYRVVGEAVYGREEGLELVYMTQTERAELTESLTEAAQYYRRAGVVSRDLVSGVAARIINLSDVSQSLTIEAEARVRTQAGRADEIPFNKAYELAKERRLDVLEEKIEREVIRLAEYIDKAEAYKLSSTISMLLGTALRSASAGHAVERGGSRKGMVRTKSKTRLRSVEPKLM